MTCLLDIRVASSSCILSAQHVDVPAIVRQLAAKMIVVVVVVVVAAAGVIVVIVVVVAPAGKLCKHRR